MGSDDGVACNKQPATPAAAAVHRIIMPTTTTLNGETTQTTTDEDDVAHIPVHVSESDVLAGARRILAVLRPTWSAESIQFKLFTDGITNKLVGCYHRPSSACTTPPSSSSSSPSQTTSDSISKNPTTTTTTTTSSSSSNNSTTNAPDSPTSAASSSPLQTSDVVLIRIYGNKTDLLIDRQAETRNIKMLQRHGFAPRLYAVFENGLAYEFVPGVTLSPVTVTSAAVWPLVARHMAKMHRLAVPAPSGGGGCDGAAPEAMLGAKTRAFLALVPQRFGNADVERRVRAVGLPAIGALRTEFEALFARLAVLGSPVVFAHNDLLLGNVIYEQAAGRVAFIDYEYAAHNYQAFDIGNHFTEFAGIDEIDYARYPDREFQCAWLREYLVTYNGDDGPAEVTEDAVRRLYGQVNAFALASHFFWTVWALIQVEHSTIDFDFVEFAVTRYNEYLARKEDFLALAVE